MANKLTVRTTDFPFPAINRIDKKCTELLNVKHASEIMVHVQEKNKTYLVKFTAFTPKFTTECSRHTRYSPQESETLQNPEELRRKNTLLIYLQKYDSFVVIDDSNKIGDRYELDVTSPKNLRVVVLCRHSCVKNQEIVRVEPRYSLRIVNMPILLAYRDLNIITEGYKVRFLLDHHQLEEGFRNFGHIFQYAGNKQKIIKAFLKHYNTERPKRNEGISDLSARLTRLRIKLFNLMIPLYYGYRHFYDNHLTETIARELENMEKMSDLPFPFYHISGLDPQELNPDTLSEHKKNMQNFKQKMLSIHNDLDLTFDESQLSVSRVKVSYYRKNETVYIEDPLSIPFTIRSDEEKIMDLAVLSIDPIYGDTRYSVTYHEESDVFYLLKLEGKTVYTALDSNTSVVSYPSFSRKGHMTLTSTRTCLVFYKNDHKKETLLDHMLPIDDFSYHRFKKLGLIQSNRLLFPYLGDDKEKLKKERGSTLDNDSKIFQLHTIFFPDQHIVKTRTSDLRYDSQTLHSFEDFEFAVKNNKVLKVLTDQQIREIFDHVSHHVQLHTTSLSTQTPDNNLHQDVTPPPPSAATPQTTLALQKQKNLAILKMDISRAVQTLESLAEKDKKAEAAKTGLE